MTREAPIMRPDASARDCIDGDVEVARNARGERVTEADVAALVEQIERRPRGVPVRARCVDGVRARVRDELRAALAERARQDERRESEVLRDALAAYLTRS